jgi:pyruvate,water dikinase
MPFPGTGAASIAHVGGKGYSLIRLAALGLPVPPGVVLTTGFFEPWVASMLACPQWQALAAALPAQVPALCESLQQPAAGLPLTDLQHEAIAAARARLAQLTDSQLFAVRSSSPQEDLVGASFAGGYLTRLGVGPGEWVDAIRACFASTFAERVMAYTAARGIDFSTPSMAVVIQEQVLSEVAGVAFSLNPLNNDHDQMVIDANWGQGETVVAGEVSPDHWVLDKLSGDVIDHAIGEKPLSRWVQADGTLVDRHDQRSREACLSPDQLRVLLNLVKRIESEFALPVDVEWAIAGNVTHILQARPVTAFVPLPDALLTWPGERRRLYMDIALSSGLTINATISPMGLSVFRGLFKGLSDLAFGRLDFGSGPEDTLLVFAGGRMYLDLSNVMWLGGPRLMARKLQIHDAALARTLESIDSAAYRSQRRPVWAGWRMLLQIPRAWWRLRRMLGNSIFPLFAPRRMHRSMSAKLAAYESELRQDIEASLPLAEFWKRQVSARLQTLFEVSLAAVAPGVLAVQGFVRLAEPLVRDEPELRQRLDRGFEGNVVVAMSVAMHRLTSLLGSERLRDPEELARRLAAGTLPVDFLDAWSRFAHHFGCRGPMEMDLAHPRYADAPTIALGQIAAMPVDASEYDPAAAVLRQIERRRQAVVTVIGRAGPIRRRLLQHLHQVIELYAGMRDTPKQHLLMILHGLRRRILLEGEALHRQGRIDAPQQVFDFEIDELLAAAADSGFNLRQRRLQRRGDADRLALRMINFPPLIDSRGRIPRVPRGSRRDGEFCGVGLSPGVVSGRARTLRSPHDGPLVRGEILIAYTTDPGWTPIFANAAAVVLEIGGALQHGAVVAREFGLPCVAGIVGISTAIRDGQMLEVDGAAGTVRLLAPVSLPEPE